MNDYAALSKRIHASLRDVDRNVRRTLELSAKARTSEDDGYWDGVLLLTFMDFIQVSNASLKILRGQSNKTFLLARIGTTIC